ncbi:MAG: SCP2 sterol-binding domain-containing protein, partial [Promethearchaeota archaeon]
ITLVISSVCFAIQLIQIDNETIIDVNLFIYLHLFLFIFGCVLILLGIFESIGMINRFKKILNNPNITEIFERNPPSSTANRIGGGLQIIRPMMPESRPDELKQVPKSTSNSRMETSSKSTKVSHPTQNTETSKKTDDSYTSISLNLEEALQMIVDRYNTEKVRKSFKNWNNTLMMSFPDLEKSYLYKISGIEGLEFSEGIDENAAVQVKMDSMVYRKMMNKQINPIKAYSSGALEVKGEMKNMLKLRKLMF